MIAVIPQWLSDAAAFIGAVTVIAGGITAIITRKPFRWVWRTMVAEPFAHWFRARSVEANEQLASALEEHRKYVRYHLGPNGDVKPVHVRLRNLEEALPIEDQKE